MKNNIFSYKWKIADNYLNNFVKKHNLKVYSTFACGGGSTMGYKLAGYNVIGANDIDKKMKEIYIINHNPKFFDLCPIKELLNKQLPEEYYNLDILDGSPPCSTFSISGLREKSWKQDKQFREGQSKQVLSDLFFDWIKLVDKLQPKIAIAENVQGMLFGNAKAYTKLIILELNKIGYDVQLFNLNAATMGVPQSRKRVFFICRKKTLNLPKLILSFNYKRIPFLEIKNSICKNYKKTTELEKSIWENRKETDLTFAYTLERMGKKPNQFSTSYVKENLVINTITAHDNCILYKEGRKLNNTEYCLAGSYPLDYNFLTSKNSYVIGMSVPPIMMAQIAYEVYQQWLK